MKIFTLQKFLFTSILFFSFVGTPFVLHAQTESSETFEWGLSLWDQIQEYESNGFVYDNFLFDNTFLPNSIYTTNNYENYNAVSPSTISLVNSTNVFELVSIDLSAWTSAENIQISGLRDDDVVACYQISIAYSEDEVFEYTRTDIEAGTEIVAGTFTNIDEISFKKVDGDYEITFDNFTYILSLKLDLISPSYGSESGGTSVSIYGENFTSATGVNFGSTAATNFEIVSDSLIVATSPAGMDTVEVSVVLPDETIDGLYFTYNESNSAPSISSLSANYGLESGGDTIIITGENFTDATSVNFDGTKSSNFTIISDTEIKAITPTDTGAVMLSVTTDNGTSMGSEFEYVVVEIEFALTSASADESVESAEILIEQNYAVGQAITVSYTVSGSATGEGIDYSLASGTVTIEAGEISNTISIEGIVDDLLQEDDESIIITLSNPINAILGSDSVYKYVIEDNELNATAITELDAGSISVYPNPATSTLNISGSTGMASLYSLSSIKVLSLDLSKNNSVDISGLSKGTYILNVDGENIKIMKE
jgi:hypothetical protein